jgi:hypothetical protein
VEDITTQERKKHIETGTLRTLHDKGQLSKEYTGSNHKPSSLNVFGDGLVSLLSFFWASYIVCFFKKS